MLISILQHHISEINSIVNEIGYTKSFTSNVKSIMFKRGVYKRTIHYFILDLYIYQVLHITIPIEHINQFDYIEDRMVALLQSKTSTKEFFSITELEILYALL